MRGWPAADALNARIDLSERVNGRPSALHGMGRTFVALGREYGIHPGVVAAICQRECQLGADGSLLPGRHNYGGVTARPWRGDGTGFFFKDRWWAAWPSPESGLRGIYQVLDEPQYRRTDGTLGAVMQLYSPPFENDWDALWALMATVGRQVGTPLEAGTRVYRRRAWWRG